MSLLLAAEHVFQPGLGCLPKSWCLTLSLADDLFAKRDHLLGFILADVADEEFTAYTSCLRVRGIIGLLGIVDKVLQQERKYF